MMKPWIIIETMSGSEKMTTDSSEAYRECSSSVKVEPHLSCVIIWKRYEDVYR